MVIVLSPVFCHDGECFPQSYMLHLLLITSTLHTGMYAAVQCLLREKKSENWWLWTKIIGDYINYKELFSFFTKNSKWIYWFWSITDQKTSCTVGYYMVPLMFHSVCMASVFWIASLRHKGLIKLCSLLAWKCKAGFIILYLHLYPFHSFQLFNIIWA